MNAELAKLTTKDGRQIDEFQRWRGKRYAFVGIVGARLVGWHADGKAATSSEQGLDLSVPPKEATKVAKTVRAVAERDQTLANALEFLLRHG